MKISKSFTALAFLPLFLLTGCANEAAPETVPTDEPSVSVEVEEDINNSTESITPENVDSENDKIIEVDEIDEIITDNLDAADMANKEQIIGIWQHPHHTFIFNENGTFIQRMNSDETEHTGNWNIANNVLILFNDEHETSSPFELSEDGNELSFNLNRYNRVEEEVVNTENNDDVSAAENYESHPLTDNPTVKINYFETPRIMYATTNLNIRYGPGTGYDRVGGLGFRNSIEIVGETNGWLVTANDNFIHAPLLSETQPPAPVVNTNSNSGSSTSGVNWRTWVANSGGQEAISACTGGLTLFDANVGFPFYALHRHCGGQRMLNVPVGGIIQIGETRFEVISSHRVYTGHGMDWMIGSGYDAAIQTTLPPTGSGVNRMVGLRRIG